LSQYSFPNSASYPPFSEPLIEEKSSLQRTLKEVIEAQKQFEDMMASLCPQNLQKSYSSFPEPIKEKSLWEKTMEFVQETERIIKNIIEFPCPSDVHMTQESCHFGNLASISSYQPELNQHPIPDTLASYPYPEIEFEDECKPELQVSDSSPILESISTPVVLPELSDALELVLILILPELESIISLIHISSLDVN